MTNVNFDHELALGILRDFLVGLSWVKTNWAEHCFWRLVNFLLALGSARKKKRKKKEDMLHRVLHTLRLNTSLSISLWLCLSIWCQIKTVPLPVLQADSKWISGVFFLLRPCMRGEYSAISSAAKSPNQSPPFFSALHSSANELHAGWPYC